VCGFEGGKRKQRRESSVAKSLSCYFSFFCTSFAKEEEWKILELLFSLPVDIGET
jgi:hypothetical protein